MLELIIVRHGQSVADIENRYEGRADFPLTNLGREQATKLALWLKTQYPPDFIMSSPLKRASETAEIIRSQVGIKVNYDNNLMELDTGALAGLLRSEADKKYPYPTGGHKPHEKILGGESLISFRARAEMFWSKLICDFYEEYSHRRVFIISHGGMINMLFRCFLNLPMNSDITLRTGDTGVHLWRVEKDKKSIAFQNYREHLL